MDFDAGSRCLRHLDGLLWPWPLTFESRVLPGHQQGLLNIPCKFQGGCTSRSWDFVITRDLPGRTNGRTNAADKQPKNIFAFVDTFGWWRHTNKHKHELNWCIGPITPKIAADFFVLCCILYLHSVYSCISSLLFRVWSLNIGSDFRLGLLSGVEWRLR